MSSVADRVLGLIEASGLSRRAFGEQVGLDESKLSKSLGGSRRFSSLELARIAELSQVTVDWLITGEEPPLAAAARTTGGTARPALDTARALTTLRADLTLLGYRQPWRPVPPPPAGGRADEQGRRLAAAALERLAEGGHRMPVPELATAVEESFGVDVAVVELGAGFDGLAATTPTAQLIVLATATVPARQRFTLAHELAHLLAGDDHTIHLDVDVYDRAQAKDPSERRANAFAAAFLMPEPLLRAASGATGLTEASFANLACDLAVTPAALAVELLRLRLIDAGTSDRWRRFTAATAANHVGRGEEFAVRVSRASRARPPGLLLRDTYAAYESGQATLRPYANLLGVDVEQLRSAIESEESGGAVEPEDAGGPGGSDGPGDSDGPGASGRSEREAPDVS